MSDESITRCAADVEFRVRITNLLAAAGSGVPTADMARWVTAIAAMPEIAAAYEAAGNTSTITDAMLAPYIWPTPRLADSGGGIIELSSEGDA